MIGANAVIGGQLFIVQQLDLQVTGKNIPQRVLDLRGKALFDGVLLKHVAAVQHQCRILHSHHRYLIKPCVDGSVGQLLPQPVKYGLPYVGQ